MSPTRRLSRRDALALAAAAGAGFVLRREPLAAQADSPLARVLKLPLITKPIPSSGERLPVVGLGTAQSWGSTPHEQLVALLRRMPELGAKVVDTAPAYQQSEIALGEAVNELKSQDRMFLATKVSVGGRGGGGRGGAGGGAEQGIASMEESMRRLHTTRIDLMQVWNLGGPDVLLPIMREWKQAGKIRYIGVTCTSDGQYPTLMDLMKREKLDFIQVDYAINNRNVADQILPLALDRGIGVITALPFGRTSVFQRIGTRPVPGFAADIDCISWPQLCLKYLVSHPAVLVAIPGTTNVAHLEDNIAAAHGRMPDAAMRTRIEQAFDALS